MAARKLQEVLNTANLAQIAEALKQVALGDMLAAPFVETLVVGAGGGFAANTVVLARPAMLIENVYDDTDSKSLEVIPTGKAPVDQVSCAISADRKTLTLNAGGDGNTILVTYAASAVDVANTDGF